MDPGWHHGRREGTCGFQDKRSQPSDAIGTCTPHEGAFFALASVTGSWDNAAAALNPLQSSWDLFEVRLAASD